MSESKKGGFELSGPAALASALHAQLLARRRGTLEHDIKNVVHALLSGTELLNKSLANPAARIKPADCIALLQQQLTRAQTTLMHLIDEIAPPQTEQRSLDLGALLTDCTHALRHPLQTLDLHSQVDTGMLVQAVMPRLKDALLAVLLDCIDRTPPRGSLLVTAKRHEDTASVTIKHAQAEGVAPSATIDLLQDLLALDRVQLQIDLPAPTRRRILLSAPLSAAALHAAASEILVLDANRDAADSLGMLLQLEGFSALACYDARDALERARVHPPSVVLLDIDGTAGRPEVVRDLRTAAPAARFIGLSHSPASSVPEGVEASLLKPLEIDALRSLLATP